MIGKGGKGYIEGDCPRADKKRRENIGI